MRLGVSMSPRKSARAVGQGVDTIEILPKAFAADGIAGFRREPWRTA
jgi:hypothetical protein